MSKVEKVGLGSRFLKNLKERRKEGKTMRLELTKEAVQMIHLMLVVPHQAWKKEDHYDPKDKLIRRDVSSLMRWVDKHLLQEVKETDEEASKTLLQLLNELYEKGAPDKAKSDAWKRSAFLFGREYKAGSYGLKEKGVERLKEILKHYVDKKSTVRLDQQISDLEEALDSNGKIGSADDMVEELEQQDEVKKEKEVVEST